MVRSTKFRRLAGLLCAQLGGRVSGVDRSTHRVPILVGLGLSGQREEQRQADHDERRDAHQDNGDDQDFATRTGSRGAQEAEEETRSDRISPIQSARGLRIPHHIPPPIWDIEPTLCRAPDAKDTSIIKLVRGCGRIVLTT